MPKIGIAEERFMSSGCGLKDLGPRAAVNGVALNRAINLKPAIVLGKSDRGTFSIIILLHISILLHD